MNANSGAAIYGKDDPEPQPQPEPEPKPDPDPDPKPKPEPEPIPEPEPLPDHKPDPTPDEIPPFVPDTNPSTNEEDSFNGILLDLIIGGFLVFVLLLITCVCYCLRRGGLDKETKKEVYKELA